MFLGGATATAVGGTLAYIGSWRTVYFAYGISELILAFVMLKTLERDQPMTAQFNMAKAYKEPLQNFRFMRLVITIFFVGFSVFGTFTYSGKLVQEITGFNLLLVGLLLSLFGIGTVIGGRIAPRLKVKLENRFLAFAGIVGFISLWLLSHTGQTVLLALGLLGFGFAFIFLQSTLVATAQEKLPKMRGTAMSLASFNMFVGGAVGTNINGRIMTSVGVEKTFANAAFIIFLVGIAAAIFVSGFEKRKKQEAYSNVK
jgi:predicted MFS family arabinose efflux permease